MKLLIGEATVEQLLEALETKGEHHPRVYQASTAMKEALAQLPLPVQPERQPNRVNFEKWLRNRWTDGYACPKEDGKYSDEVAQAFWECWQAAHNIGAKP